MRRTRSESGQATVEWVGLVLGVALVFGALVAGGREAARGQSGRELGQAIAGRVVCAVRDACGARAVGRPVGPRAGRAPAKPRAPAAPRPRSAPPARAAKAARALPRGREALGHAWLACFAYRRFEYEREHPMTPRDSVPLDDAVDIINDCLDPLSFLFG
jgi:hypothetical protein